MQHDSHVQSRRVWRAIRAIGLTLKWVGIALITFVAVVAAVVHSFDRMHAHRRHEH